MTLTEGEYRARIDCLAMFVRRLSRKLRKYEPDTEVLSQARTYLIALGQAGTPMHAEEATMRVESEEQSGEGK